MRYTKKDLIHVDLKPFFLEFLALKGLTFNPFNHERNLLNVKRAFDQKVFKLLDFRLDNK